MENTNFAAIPPTWGDYARDLFPAEQTVMDGQAFILEYADWQLSVRHRRPATIEAYVTVLGEWLDWVFPQSLWAATVPQAEGFVTRPRSRRAHGRVGAPGTQRRDVAILRSAYQYAWERGYTPNHLMRGLHAPQVHNKDPKPILDEHWVALWSNPRLSPSDVAALGLGYVCGLRRQEIYGATVSMVTPTEIVEFRRKGGKTQTLPWATMLNVLTQRLPHVLPDPMRFPAALAELVENQRGTDPLLRWVCIEESAFNKKMHKWCAEVGVPRYSPHQLRHSCATNLVRAGVPMPLVSQLMGHSNPQTTYRYVRAGGRELTEWLENR